MAETPEKKRYQSLVVDYVKYRTELTEKFRKRKAYVEKDPRKITAFIPGTVRRVFAKKGKKVREGDKLLVLEAMKMKNVIISPMDGVIKEVYAKQGETVPKEAILIELE
jgi:biotin carboxyl carrier protein